MNLPAPRRSLRAISLAFMLLVAGAGGNRVDAAILIDFGGTSPTNQSPGFDATVSPAHAAGAVPTSEATWNGVPVGGTAATLLNSNGISTANVKIVLGTETSAGSNILTFATGPGGNLTGTAATDVNSIYGGTRAQKDGLFPNAGSAIGFRLDGLEAGEYTLYFTARNTNSNLTGRSQRVYAGTGTSAATYNFAPELNFADITNGGAITAQTFSQGINYNVLNFTITGTQSLFVAVDGTSVDETRGFLNAMQIVAIPEPGSAILLGLAGLGLVLRRRR